MRTLSIAALQTVPAFRDPEVTLELFARMAVTLRDDPHAQPPLLPELHLSAPPRLLDEVAGYPAEVAVELPGPLTDRLAEVAVETGLWLVPGSVASAADGRVHNTAVAGSPEGELVATYRKAFPWQPLESTAPGDRFVTFEVPDLCRIGLADLATTGSGPRRFRQLAELGAEVVLQLNAHYDQLTAARS